MRRQQVLARDEWSLGLSNLCVSVCSDINKRKYMTASLGWKRVSIHLTQAHVLSGSIAAFFLAGYAFSSGWFDWASLFRLHPLLSIPCTLSLFIAPAMFYISVRQMTEIGVWMRLVLSALLSAAAVGFIALGLRLWLQNAAA
jgi:hypothetical protein